MMTKIWGHAAPAVRKALNLAAPAMVVGLMLGSQAYGIVYPSGAVGRLEKSIDAILLKERLDILRENNLIHTQNAIGNVINILNVKLQNTTDPAKQAIIEQQIAQKEAQYNQFQSAINAQGQVLLRNLTVLNPAKDRGLQQLSVIGRNSKQVAQFVLAASQREATYAQIMRNFLRAHPVSPLAPF